MRPIIKKQVIKGLAAIAVVGVFVLGCMFAQAYHIRLQATRFLTIIQQVEVGKTTEADFQKSTQAFSKYASQGESSFPYRGPKLPTTSFEFVTAIGDQWPVRVIPFTRAEFEVTFRNGIAVQKFGALLSTKCHAFGWVTEVVPGIRREPYSRPGEVGRKVNGDWNTCGMRSIWIQDDNTVSLDQRYKDWQFAMSCLTKLGGCMDATDLLPIEAARFKEDTADPSNQTEPK
jgi:hypothetical protein